MLLCIRRCEIANRSACAARNVILIQTALNFSRRKSIQCSRGEVTAAVMLSDFDLFAKYARRFAPIRSFYGYQLNGLLFAVHPFGVCHTEFAAAEASLMLRTIRLNGRAIDSFSLGIN